MIRRVEIGKEVAEKLGLAPTEFRGLGQVIVLAGPNGAGKSRYMTAVRNAVTEAANARTGVQGRRQQLERLQVQQLRLDNEIAVAMTLLDQDGQPAARDRLDVLRADRDEAARLASLEPARILRAEQARDRVRLEGSGEPTRFISLDYSSDDAKIVDPETARTKDVSALAAQVTAGGFGTAHGAMHAYVSVIARTLFNAGHPTLGKLAGVQDAAEDAWEFNRILQGLLGSEVSYGIDDSANVVPHLRGRVFRRSELSKGEKVLLTWAITLHKQKATFSDAVVMIDEPEVHLHPDVCVQALERLKTLLGARGQIWLATHSVPLVAYLGVESLYWVKENQAIYARDKVEQVMESLLGGTRGREHLQKFLADADNVAANRFLAECLSHPDPVDTGDADPQKSMFRKLVQERITVDGALRLLDFGAGRGRLASALAPLTAPTVTYCAYNHPAHTRREDRDACVRNIQALGQADTGQLYWESVRELEASLAEKFDVVVLCNVLHEIDPMDWLVVAADVDRLLKPKGVLLVIEDAVPSVGELPHSGGHLVLDEAALRTLFDAPLEVRLVRADARGRLIAVEVPKVALGRASNDTRTRTLEGLRRQARERIHFLRGTAQRDAKTGREHAHFMVQFANASLVLERLGGREPSDIQPPVPTR